MSAGRAFRDGVFSTAEPRAGFASHSQIAYADGSLGQVGREFRDGLFSQAAPQARYQQLTQQYQDGSLGLALTESQKKLAMGGAAVAVLAIGYMLLRKKRRR